MAPCRHYTASDGDYDVCHLVRFLAVKTSLTLLVSVSIFKAKSRLHPRSYRTFYRATCCTTKYPTAPLRTSLYPAHAEETLSI